MLKKLFLRDNVEDVLLGRMRVMMNLNAYLLAQGLPMYWSPTGFNTQYLIDLKSIGFDLKYWCFTFYLDHLESGKSIKVGLKPSAPMPLAFEVKRES